MYPTYHSFIWHYILWVTGKESWNKLQIKIQLHTLSLSTHNYKLKSATCFPRYSVKAVIVYKYWSWCYFSMRPKHTYKTSFFYYYLTLLFADSLYVPSISSPSLLFVFLLLLTLLSSATCRHRFWIHNTLICTRVIINIIKLLICFLFILLTCLYSVFFISSHYISF
jgi:hypothetical protein